MLLIGNEDIYPNLCSDEGSGCCSPGRGSGEYLRQAELGTEIATPSP